VLDPKTHVLSCDTEGCAYTAILPDGDLEILPLFWRWLYVGEERTDLALRRGLKAACPLCVGAIEHALHDRQQR